MHMHGFLKEPVKSPLKLLYMSNNMKIGAKDRINKPTYLDPFNPTAVLQQCTMDWSNILQYIWGLSFFLMCTITQNSADWKTYGLHIHLFTHNTEPLYDSLQKHMNQQSLVLRMHLSRPRSFHSQQPTSCHISTCTQV